MQHLISVITPTYNHQNYISECINSVQLQTYTNWEMIIVDDGSKDNTLSVANDFAKKDDRIRVYTQAHVGILRLSETYNLALKYAQGDYIAILEGDDYWEPEKLSMQAKVLDNNPEIILCWGQAKSISSDQKIIYNIYPDSKSKESAFFNNDPTGSILEMLLYKDWIPALTILIRKDELLNVGGFHQSEGMPTVDLPTLLQLSLIGKFGFIPSALGCWRNYAGQITKIYPAVLSEGYFKLVKEFLKENSDHHFVKSLNSKNVYSFHRKQLIIAYSRSGRYKLIRKEFSEARKDYCKSIFSGGLNEPVWKLRSLTGLIFSFFHINVESLSAFLGKKTYSVD
jgi:glycosyltransferase involved in cell wall biosynthesis